LHSVASNCNINNAYSVMKEPKIVKYRVYNKKKLLWRVSKDKKLIDTINYLNLSICSATIQPISLLSD